MSRSRAIWGVPALLGIVAILVAGVLFWTDEDGVLRSLSGPVGTTRNEGITARGGTPAAVPRARAEPHQARSTASWHEVYVLDLTKPFGDPRRYSRVRDGAGPVGDLPRISGTVVVVTGRGGDRSVDMIVDGVPADYALGGGSDRVAWNSEMREAGTTSLIKTLICDEGGVPWGTLQPGERVGLPAGFRGFVSTDAHAAERISFHPARGVAHAYLRKSAWFTGRCIGAVDPRGRLVAQDLEPSGLAHDPVSAIVHEDGSFSFGPIAVGPKSLRFTGRKAFLKEGARHQVLRAGHQHIGELVLESTYSLTLQLDRPIDGAVFVGVRVSGSNMPTGLSAVSCTSRQGRIEIGPYIDRAMQVAVWTRTGWYGQSDDQRVLPSSTSASSPLRIELSAPGAVDVSIVGGPFRLPRGSRVVISGSLYAVSRGWASAGSRDIPAERLKWATLVDGSHVTGLEGIWPCGAHVALMSAEGTTLMSKYVRVRSGSRERVRFDLSELAKIRLLGRTAEDRRFVMLQEGKGIILRGVLPANADRDYLVPAGTYSLRIVRNMEPTKSIPLTLVASAVEDLEVK